MATATIDGIRIFYELGGTGGVPLVLVHGSWGSHHGWDLVAPGLRQSLRVVTYDRRGHSQSERPGAQGSVREDVADLAALIDHLGLAPAWVAGNSFGASIALRLAGERPDLLRGVIAHEPPLLALLAGDPVAAPMLEEVSRRIRAVVDRIASGDHAGAAEQFVETVALGPGAWAQLAPDIQQTFIENAPTFLDEARDPEQLAFDPARIKAFPRPALLTMGDQSPPIFAPVVARLRDAAPGLRVATFAGAGHIPHVTHASAYVDAITAFVHEHAAGRERGRETMPAGTPADCDRRFEEFVRKGDLDALMTLYEDDASLVQHDGRVITGHAAIREALARLVAMRPQLRVEIVKVVTGGGDLAMVYNDWTLAATAADGSPIRRSGKALEVVRRQADGTWRVACDDPFARG